MSKDLWLRTHERLVSEYMDPSCILDIANGRTDDCRDRPVWWGYFASFFWRTRAFFALCGRGGVFSIRRTTSSKFGAGRFGVA